ncbi:hypothetical protein AAMO2058_000183500 [Amorphochlora amoebiformis]
MSSQSDIVQMVTCGAGPALAAIFSNPLEVVKVRMQMHMARSHAGIVTTASQIIKENGVTGLQAGLQMSMFRELFKCSVRIGAYKPILNRIHDKRYGKAPWYKSLVAGGSCGVLSALWANPLDLMKTKRQNNPAFSTRDMLMLVRREGFLSLWTGVKVSMCRSLVATASSVPIKYQLQDMLQERGFRAHTTSDLIAQSLICSFPAATIAVLFMQPFDVVRTRVYNHNKNVAKGMSKASGTPAQVAANLVRKEGVLAFWKGTTAHIMRFVPHTVLSFAFIDLLQKAVDVIGQSHSWS